MEEIFAERLRGLLWHRKITQKELADLSGLTPAAVSHYVNGKQCPNSSALILIADALKVSTDYLLGRTNKEQILR